MKLQYKASLFLILCLLAISVVSAVPTTNAATMVDSNNATVSMSGAAGECWFIWGQQDKYNETWRTPNSTPIGGVCSYRIKGSPLLGDTKFYYAGCDSTGCGNELYFITLEVTPIPTTTYGAIFDNLTENGMDLTLVGWQSTAPYMWLVPGFKSLVWGVIFMFIFIGLWLRGRDVTVPTIVGFIAGSFLFSSGYGLNLGIPLEFAGISQGLMYASLAGIILAIIKK